MYFSLNISVNNIIILEVFFVNIIFAHVSCFGLFLLAKSVLVVQSGLSANVVCN